MACARGSVSVNRRNLTRLRITYPPPVPRTSEHAGELPLGQDIPGQGFVEPRSQAAPEVSVVELEVVVVVVPPEVGETFVGELPNDDSVKVTEKLENSTPLSPYVNGPAPILQFVQMAHEEVVEIVVVEVVGFALHDVMVLQEVLVTVE